MKLKTALLLCLFVLVTALALSLEKEAHDFTDDQCAQCHTGGTSGDSITESLTNQCLSCHTDIFTEGYMHPVDIKPQKFTPPVDLPLSSQGMITCNTCHDVHASAMTPFGTNSSYLRRLEQGKAFCDVCHLNTRTAAGHEMVFIEAHFTSKYIATDSTSEIDAMSKNCISCHDGSVGSSVMVKAGFWRHTDNFIKFDKGGKHPIGMDYENIRRSNIKASLKPIGQVDRRIMFFDGNKVGCGSCHDPFSSKEKKLVIENTRSALCYSCHDQ